MGSQNSSIVSGFIDEVTTYIPLLRSGIKTLSAEPHRVEVVQELHRLVHIIHGAASLVGLVALSHAAAPMEEALEEAMEGGLSVDDPLLGAMEETVGCFDAFARGQVTGRDHEIAMVADSVVVFRRLRGLPEAGDDEVMALFFEDLGEDVVSEAPLDAPEPALCVEEDDALDLLLAEDPLGEESLQGMPLPGDVADVDPFAFEEPPVGPDPFPVQEPVCPAGAFSGEDAPRGVAPEILAVFNDEVEEHVESINRNLEALEAGVTEAMPMGPDEKERLRQVRRAVHTIKGASSLVGMTALPAWAHRVEDLLDWLYDEASEITPDVVAVLLKATDIMALFLTDPSRVADHEMDGLDTAFRRIRGASPAGEAPVPEGAGHEPPEESAGIFDSLSVEEEETVAQEVFPAGTSAPSGTFRVGMEKLDDLVNLASEQIIALSSFDQKLDALMGTVSELDLSRARLRETSRSLQVGYEVKAIAKPGAGAVEAASGGADPFSDFDSLELDRYSEFNLMLRDLAESAVDIGEIYSVMQTLHSDFEGYVTRQRVLLSELQGKLMHIRMAPMSVITTRMRRAVREVTDRLGKKVRLTIRGEGIELDRVIWEKLADPLLHILRNAVDHGIEDPETRRKAGKPDTGVIAVSASREGNEVLIRIRDDGAGLNLAAIRRRAETMPGVDASAMDDDELVSLVFAPGFSTRGEVTEISGRGVGMDVVKTNIEELKGSVRISSSGAGKGTVLLVRIPLTLAVTRAILCTAAGRTFAVPLNEISDILRVYPANMLHEPMESVRVDDEVFPLYHLSRVLGITDEDASRKGVGDRPLVLKIESPERTAALAVDALLGQREIVIKSLGSHLQYVKGISGATVMGDGSLVPILNVRELLDGEVGETRPAALASTPSAEAPLEVLIVDDSVSVRQVVARLLEDQGWKTASARDGVEALEKLSSLRPDVIILDVEMPRMNGYEFLGAKRSHPAYRDIPVIMLTSRSTAKYREKARTLGADGYVVKPFDNRQFLNLIQSLTMT
ncbi:hybrid sensor histidine kinase/response regulator [Desulfoluna spongiiphila]|uniref:histidine kinase n=1 Tax=Desulfoluna spongiiphila TaxID=419481 RepID=A0A1G5CVY5_9BACT|nr:response regulator [Desulfoluna spongiiphila]SCY06418.1 chemosensory pili system protein ChpA (sensor histidine kinase/response regulator) [Desulfoluna spongiiphila]